MDGRVGKAFREGKVSKGADLLDLELIEVPKTGRKLPDTLSIEEIDDLILAIDHATALTEQIAKFIKNMKHEMFPISLNQAVSDSVRFMLPTFQKRIAVNMQMPAVDLLVMADPTDVPMELNAVTVKEAFSDWLPALIEKARDADWTDSDNGDDGNV